MLPILFNVMCAAGNNTLYAVEFESEIRYTNEEFSIWSI